MEFVLVQTYLGDILHNVAQALLAPDIVLLLLFMGYGIWCIGSVLVEALTERMNFKANMPRFLDELMRVPDSRVPDVVTTSGLLNRQIVALLTAYDYRMMPDESLVALVKRLLSQEDGRYNRIVGRNATAAKVAPMLGLMGTLIPLGPGIAALGEGDIQMLSSSIVIAFDTTVAGLVTAAVCLIVSKVRRNWYEDYMAALESSMATMIQKAEKLRVQGLLHDEDEPTGFAVDFAMRVHMRGARKLAERNRASAEGVRATGEAEVVHAAGEAEGVCASDEECVRARAEAEAASGEVPDRDGLDGEPASAGEEG